MAPSHQTIKTLPLIASERLGVFALALAAIVLYAPIYAGFAVGAWREETNAHAPIILAIAVGAAAVRLAGKRFDHGRTVNEQAVGFFLLAFGLLLIAAGKASDAALLLSASQPFVAAGLVIALLGWRGVRRLWFPIALTVYLIIWPGWAIDALTAPLKLFVSQTVAGALYAVGLPVAHAGAIISAGQYQLLVAAACSGLNSLIALTSIGAVYLYAVKHGDWRVNALVLASLIPVAITANIVRVMALTLITLYLGYDAGQGFMHDGAGLVMFAVALALVFAVDMIALRVFHRKAAR